MSFWRYLFLYRGRPRKEQIQSDEEAIASDWNAVGQDLRKAMGLYEQEKQYIETKAAPLTPDVTSAK